MLFTTMPKLYTLSATQHHIMDSWQIFARSIWDDRDMMNQFFINSWNMCITYMLHMYIFYLKKEIWTLSHIRQYVEACFIFRIFFLTLHHYLICWLSRASKGFKINELSRLIRWTREYSWHTSSAWDSSISGFLGVGQYQGVIKKKTENTMHPLKEILQ